MTVIDPVSKESGVFTNTGGAREEIKDIDGVWCSKAIGDVGGGTARVDL